MIVMIRKERRTRWWSERPSSAFRCDRSVARRRTSASRGFFKPLAPSPSSSLSDDAVWGPNDASDDLWRRATTVSQALISPCPSHTHSRQRRQQPTYHCPLFFVASFPVVRRRLATIGFRPVVLGRLHRDGRASAASTLAHRDTVAFAVAGRTGEFGARLVGNALFVRLFCGTKLVSSGDVDSCTSSLSERLETRDSGGGAACSSDANGFSSSEDAAAWSPPSLTSVPKAKGCGHDTGICQHTQPH